VYDEACKAECIEQVTLLAGDVTITGGTHQGLVTCTFVDKRYRCDEVGAMDFWEPGDTLTASAPGGTFPAFSVEVTAPEPVELITDTDSWTPATFDGSSDITLEWTAGSGVITVCIQSTGEEQRSMSCTTDDDGSFDVPAAGVTALFQSPTVWMVSVTRANVNVEGGVEFSASGYSAEATLMASE
jgi:hypothetical protein